jgi:predicted kinase
MDELKIIVVSGLPGSGKSTIAEAIAAKLHYPIFSADPIESSILKSNINRSAETGLAAYFVIQTLASEQLKLAMSVVIDAVSPINEARGMWRELAQKYNAQLIIIECIVQEDLHKKRLQSRVRNMHGLPEVTWDDVEKRKKEYVPWEEERLIVDTSSTNGNNVEKVLNYINGVKPAQ